MGVGNGGGEEGGGGGSFHNKLSICFIGVIHVLLTIKIFKFYQRCAFYCCVQQILSL